MRVGILTGGGDCLDLNAVSRACDSSGWVTGFTSMVGGTCSNCSFRRPKPSWRSSVATRRRTTPRVRPFARLQAIDEILSAGVEPAIWNIEGLDRPRSRELLRRLTGGDGGTRWWRSLSGGARMMPRSISGCDRRAPVEGCAGFAIGRPVWRVGGRPARGRHEPRSRCRGHRRELQEVHRCARTRVGPADRRRQCA